FFGQPPKCEVAHTSFRFSPSKVRHGEIYLVPGGDAMAPKPEPVKVHLGRKHKGSPSGGISNARRHRLHGRGQAFGCSSCSLWWRNDKGRSRAEAPKETGAPEGARAPKGETSAQFIASETKRRSGPRSPWTKSGGDRTGNPRGLYPLDEARTPGLW